MQARDSVPGEVPTPDPTATRSHPVEFEVRPWGSFSTLEEGPGYKIKRLVVQPGRRLSLQKHRHRAEHWVVVAGAATVVKGDRRLTLRSRQCTVIPRRAWHRIENHGRQPVVIIEVQHGTYLGEDDIIRQQDDYGRIEPRAGTHCRPQRGRNAMGAREPRRKTPRKGRATGGRK